MSLVLGLLGFAQNPLRITLPVSVARAKPEMPIEMPMSAVANAGASFIPSPTIAVGASF
ncbi:hypothetical protein Vadar_024385 [Vaccinium darrowii]|uniref:Uncharacterized protein n=1 Tax=Vaccinium darrowii TaxID=229202 RepID=A0ACB7YA05_9ERIC|nr:hypothetical protein Vadar_024385 [Vaccinium darrowii]